METEYTLTLEQWIKGNARKQAPILPPVAAAGFVGIHDTRAIEHGRTYLWGLADYRVSSVSGGVIWLMPRD